MGEGAGLAAQAQAALAQLDEVGLGKRHAAATRGSTRSSTVALLYMAQPGTPSTGTVRLTVSSAPVSSK